MTSVLDEISILKNMEPIVINYNNTNRYSLSIYERNATKTAFYFSSPIYNQHSRKMIDLQFHTENDMIYAIGTNADITISEKIKIKNSEGYCLIDIMKRPRMNSNKEIYCGESLLLPTTNGIAIKSYIRNTGKAIFNIEVGNPFMTVRTNNKFFTLMREKFRPFITFSCIGTLDIHNKLLTPAKIDYQKLTDTKYQLTVSAQSPNGAYVLFEANLYEQKLFQDTTVESLNSKTNNAFGSMAFIGNTTFSGEQWLYSRPDFTKMPELSNKCINRAILHLPKYDNSNIQLSAFAVSNRFCSLGSNWDNKVSEKEYVSDSIISDKYQSIDITCLISDTKTKIIKKSEGLILKTKIKGSGFTSIATGDNCYTPQILEINYQ